MRVDTEGGVPKDRGASAPVGAGGVDDASTGLTDGREIDDRCAGELSSSGQGEDVSKRSSHAARWWLAVVFGAVAGIPLSVLLSYAASLPFFIGLFFFALFGLLIGAVMFRVGSKGHPYSRGSVLAGTTIVVLAVWSGSIVIEARDFPHDMAVQAANNSRLILGDETIQQYKVRVGQEVRAFLDAGTPPGGVIGYVRWIVGSGTIPKDHLASVPVELTRSPARLLWVLRVALSVALLAFGVSSQTLPLSEMGAGKGEDGSDESGEERHEEGGSC